MIAFLNLFPQLVELAILCLKVWLARNKYSWEKEIEDDRWKLEEQSTKLRLAGDHERADELRKSESVRITTAVGVLSLVHNALQGSGSTDDKGNLPDTNGGNLGEPPKVS